MKTEHILATSADLFKEVEGIEEKAGLVAYAPVHGKDLFIGQRAMLETTSLFRHFIPYIVFVSGADVLTYKRTKKGGEDRLHESHSVGFGGHVDMLDIVCDQKGRIDFSESMRRAIRREVNEELSFVSGEGVLEELIVGSMEPQAYILDNSNDVGKVHIGLLYVVTLPPSMPLANFESNEDKIELIGGKNPIELLQSDIEIEGWSLAVLESFAQHLKEAQAQTEATLADEDAEMPTEEVA